MRFLKTILYKFAGERNYLTIISYLFFVLYRSGLLKFSGKFDTHYLAPALVRKGWVVIDIGANLGYYSVILAEATGKTGKLFAVEPIDDYRMVLTHNIKKLPWVEVIPYALGDKNGTVRMMIPGRDKTRHGLTRITDKDKGENKDKNNKRERVTAGGGTAKDVCLEAELENDTPDDTDSGKTTGTNSGNAAAADISVSGGWDVEIRRAADLFGNIETVHYIKCDIEGYEAKLFPDLMPMIRKSKPIIQVEISKQNRSLIRDLIMPEGYSSFRAERGGLVPENAGEIIESDTIFIPDEKLGDYSELINN